MSKPYTITIAKGTGKESILNDTYSVTAAVAGYDATTIDPATITVNTETNEFDFHISATGKLTFHVSEDGTAEGTAVVGAEFQRCDSEGNLFGDPVTSDDSGQVLFEHLPHAEADGPMIHFKQLKSDESHDFDATIIDAQLTQEENTMEVKNLPAVENTFTLKDINYGNIPIDSGTITLS